MWVGPGGFIGNFAFRFSKKQKFSSLRLSLSLLTSRIVVLLFTRNRLLTVGRFCSSQFFLPTPFESCVSTTNLKKKTGNTAGSHSRFLSRSRNTRENERREADFYHTWFIIVNDDSLMNNDINVNAKWRWQWWWWYWWLIGWLIVWLIELVAVDLLSCYLEF